MKKIFSILALLLMAVTGAWAAAEELVYTLDGTQTNDHTAYASGSQFNLMYNNFKTFTL